MTGLWLGGSIANATDIATNLATSAGTTLTANASTTYTAGAWTQLTAATPHDCNWMLVTLPHPYSTGLSIAVDIGIGASGSEFVVVPNLMSSSSWHKCATFYFPLMIPAGTRVAARLSSNVLSDTTQLQVHIFDDSYGSPGTGSAIDSYGFQNTLNLGTAIDAGGTVFTFGSYYTIAASTTNDLAGFWIAFDNQGSTGGSLNEESWQFDLAVGASGSEVVLLTSVDATAQFSTSNVWIFDPVKAYYPIPITAGSRISGRSLFGSTSTPARILGVTLWGVRQ